MAEIYRSHYVSYYYFPYFRGVKSVVIEKRTGPLKDAQAILMNSHTMEHMRHLGLEWTFQDHSFPHNQPRSLILATSILAETPIFLKQFSSWGDAVDGINETDYDNGF